MRTLKGQISFAFSGAQIWNNLPEHLKRAFEKEKLEVFGCAKKNSSGPMLKIFSSKPNLRKQ